MIVTVIRFAFVLCLCLGLCWFLFLVCVGLSSVSVLSASVCLCVSRSMNTVSHSVDYPLMLLLMIMMTHALNQTPSPRNESLTCKNKNYNSSSLPCSQNILTVRSGFAIFSIYALLTGPSPHASSSWLLAKSHLRAGSRSRSVTSFKVQGFRPGTEQKNFSILLSLLMMTLTFTESLSGTKLSPRTGEVGPRPTKPCSDSLRKGSLVDESCVWKPEATHNEVVRFPARQRKTVRTSCKPELDVFDLTRLC